MLRLRAMVAFAAMALCTTEPTLAQPTTTGERIDAAEKKLDEDIKACRPINVSDYNALVREANQNIEKAMGAAKVGAPIDRAKLNSDINRAMELSDRARRARDTAVKACPPPQPVQPPKQAPPLPKVTPETFRQLKAGGGGGGRSSELDQFAVYAWDLLDDLDEDIYQCDIEDLRKLIPELEDAAKKARQIAEAARAAGAYSKVKPEDAEKLADGLEEAAKWAAQFKGCPKFKLIAPEFKGKPPPKTEKPEKPIPPKHSIIEDIVEPPTPAEVKAIDIRLRELVKLGNDMKTMPGCDQKAWNDHLAHLQDLAKRAREIAEWALTPGQTTGVDPKEAERVANEAQKEFDEAKKQHPVDCPKTAPEPRPPAGKPTSALPYQLDGFASRVLYIHNAERGAVGAPPLRWNPQLQQDATTWAKQLATTRQLVHSSRGTRGIERENLGQGRIGWSPDQIIASEWMSEKRDFVAGVFPNVARDGQVQNVLHYTQMIWPTTTDVGCGMATAGGFQWLVCRYSPGGNKDGRRVGMPDMPERM